MSPVHDMAFLGHYTKDTIVSKGTSRVVDGGAIRYGAYVACSMGLRAAVVTRLARQDLHALDELRNMGVDLYCRETPASTCLRLEYPSDDPDERVILVTDTAGPFAREDVRGLRAKAFLVGASMRGEVDLEVIDALRPETTIIALDVQGFVRMNVGGRLQHTSWPEMPAVLSRVDVLKTDAVEAKALTGESDFRAACRSLAAMGPKEIVLTHRDGLLVMAEGRFHEAGFSPRRLGGRSGRGDTCIASYVARRLDSPPAEATRWAAALTSLKLEQEGPFRGSLRDVQERLGTSRS